MSHDERFVRLYDRYYARVVRYFRNELTPAEAEEHAQDVFVRVYEHMDSYRGEAEWAFIETTARRLLLNTVRARHTIKREGKSVPLDAAEYVSTPATQETEVANNERSIALAAAIQALPPNIRACLLLYLNGHSYKEMERELEITEDAVKTRLHDARRRLRAKLGKELTGLKWPPENES